PQGQRVAESERPGGLALGLPPAGGRFADAAAGGPAPASRGAGDRGRGQPAAPQRDPAQRQGPASGPACGQGAAVFPAVGRVRGRRALPPEAQEDAADPGCLCAREPLGSNRTVTGGGPPRGQGRRGTAGGAGRGKEQRRRGKTHGQGLRGTAGLQWKMKNPNTPRPEEGQPIGRRPADWPSAVGPSVLLRKPTNPGGVAIPCSHVTYKT